jgi:hypothetical protein
MSDGRVAYESTPRINRARPVPVDLAYFAETTAFPLTAAAGAVGSIPVRRVMRGATAIAIMVTLSTHWPTTADAAIGAAVSSEQPQPEDPKPILRSGFESVWAELEGYREIEDGWDGSDSVAPSVSSISDALAFLAAIPDGTAVPQAMISADGYVGLYWDRESNFASVNFPGEGKLSYYATAGSIVARGTLSAVTGIIPSDLSDILVAL